MAKVRISIAFEVEYEQNKDMFPQGMAEQDMLDHDIQSAKDDPECWLSFKNAVLRVSGKFIDKYSIEHAHNSGLI